MPIAYFLPTKKEAFSAFPKGGFFFFFWLYWCHLEDGRQDSLLMVNILESRPVYCGHGARTAWLSLIGGHSPLLESDWLNPNSVMNIIGYCLHQLALVAACEAVMKKTRVTFLHSVSEPIWLEKGKVPITQSFPPTFTFRWISVLNWFNTSNFLFYYIRPSGMEVAP